jgi:hypothetical protein
LRRLAVGFFVLFGLTVTLAGDVLAIVGRPATPVSYAGAARRSVRRGYPY